MSTFCLKDLTVGLLKPTPAPTKVCSFYLSRTCREATMAKTLKPGLTSLTKTDGNSMVGIYGGSCSTHDSAGLVVWVRGGFVLLINFLQ